MRQFPILAASALALSACAPMDGAGPGMSRASGDGAPRACFTQSQVVNFRATGDNTLYLRTLRHDVFEINAGACDLGSSYALAITPTIGINDRLCVGDSARVTPNGATSFPQGPCLARITRSLTPVEIEALPERDRP